MELVCLKIWRTSGSTWLYLPSPRKQICENVGELVFRCPTEEGRATLNVNTNTTGTVVVPVLIKTNVNVNWVPASGYNVTNCLRSCCVSSTCNEKVSRKISSLPFPSMTCFCQAFCHKATNTPSWTLGHFTFYLRQGLSILGSNNSPSSACVAEACSGNNCSSLTSRPRIFLMWRTTLFSIFHPIKPLDKNVTASNSCRRCQHRSKTRCWKIQTSLQWWPLTLGAYSIFKKKKWEANLQLSEKKVILKPTTANKIKSHQWIISPNAEK